MADSLQSKAISGARWLSGATVITAGLMVAQNIILSRLLGPHDFGIAAMLWVFLGFAQILSDGGMSLATVQRSTITQGELSSVHWTNVMLAVGIAAIFYLCGPLAVAYFREPALSPLIPLGASTVVIAAFSAQFHASAQRQFHFSRLAISDVVGAVTGFVVSAGLAVWGWGVYALVLGGVASTLVRTIFLSVSVWPIWHPALHWSLQELRGFLRFGSYRIGDGVANYIWNNVDYMLVGRVLGAEALGYYRLAFEIVVRPLTIINPILNKVSYPIFAAKQSDNEALRQGFLKMIRLIASIVAPMIAGLAAIAPFAVAALFGKGWAPVAVLLQILCPLGLLRCLLNGTAQINIAKGRVAAVFFLNLTLAITLCVGFVIAVRYGLVVFCITEVVLLSTVMLATWRPLHSETFGLVARDYLSAVSKPILLSCLMGVCVYVLSLAIPADWSALWSALFLTATGMIVQFALVASMDRPYLLRLIGLIGQRS